MLFVIAPLGGVSITQSISDVLQRFGMNSIMVLAMVPMIHSGCGLNFGLPVGIIAGLLGGTISMQLGFAGGLSFVMAVLIATFFGIIFGWAYGVLLNKVKGGEMMIATYVGYAIVSFMCMMWLLLSYNNPQMVWGYKGTGLRTTISTEGYYLHILTDFMQIKIGNLVIPTGSLLFFAFFALLQ